MTLVWESVCIQAFPGGKGLFGSFSTHPGGENNCPVPGPWKQQLLLGAACGFALFFIFSLIIKAQALCFNHPDSYPSPPNGGNDVIPVVSGKLIQLHVPTLWMQLGSSRGGKGP